MVWACVAFGVISLLVVLTSMLALVYVCMQMTRTTEVLLKSNSSVAEAGYTALLSRSAGEYTDMSIQKEAAMRQLDSLEKQLEEDIEAKVDKAPAAQVVHTEDGQEINLSDPRWDIYG